MANESYKDEVLRIVKGTLSQYGVTYDDVTSQSNLGNAVYNYITNVDYQTAHAQIIERESNVITAESIESIYKHGSAANVDFKLTQPASTEILLTLTYEDIMAEGEKVNNSTEEYKFTISRIDHTMTIGEFPYMLDNDILIRFLNITPNPVISAQYVAGKYSRNPSNETLEVQKNIYRGKPCIVLKVKFYQYEEKEHIFYFNNNIYDQFMVSTTRQLVDTRVAYQDTENSAEQELKLVQYYDRSYTDAIGYRFTSPKSMTLFHRDQTGGFKPRIGGILKVYTRESYGTAGNMNYSYPPIIQTSERYIIGADSVNNMSLGALDFNLNKERLRQEVIKARSYRKVMTIENDLDSYLLPLTNNNTTLKSIMYRNDIRRIFNLFANITFKIDDKIFTIPTTTADVNVLVSEMDHKNIGLIDYYNITPKTHRIVSSKNKVNPPFDLKRIVGDPDPDEFYFYTPFICSYDMTNNEVSLYASYSNMAYSCSSYYVNDSPLIENHFIIRNIRMTNDIDGNPRMEFNVRTNNSEQTILHSIDSNGDIVDLDLLRIYMTFNGSVPDNTSGVWTPKKFKVKAKMIKYDEEKDNYIYEITFDSDHYVFHKSINVDNVYEVTTDGLFYHKDTPEPPKVTGNLLLSNSIMIDTESLIGDQYIKTNTFNADVEFLKDETSYFQIQSAIQIGSPAKVILKLTPLVMGYFYDELTGRKTLFNETQNILQAIETALPMTKTLYDIHLKYVNTAGYSKFLVVGINNRPLISLNLKPSFLLKVKDEVYDYNRLRDLIANYINNHNYDNGPLHINNMITYIKNLEDKYIDYIQFLGFENYTSDDQLISTSGETQSNSDVLENTSIALKYIPETDGYEYDIEFVENL